MHLLRPIKIAHKQVVSESKYRVRLCRHRTPQELQVWALWGAAEILAADLGGVSLVYQSWGLRPRSYDKTGLRPASVLVLVLVLYFWSCLKRCCARQALCDMIMLKCNKHLYFFRAISAETVPNVTGHHITS